MNKKKSENGQENLGNHGDSELNQVVENMPEPSPDVAAPDLSKLGREVPLDPKGREFDPDLHLTNPDGSPKLNKKTGKLCLKPGPEKSRKINPKIKVQGKDQGAETLPPGVSEARIAAEASVDALAQIGVVCFGDEWRLVKSEQYDEREGLVHPLTKYYEQKGVRDVPPGVALSIALGAYVLRRMAFENTRSRFQQFVFWVKIKAQGFFFNLSNLFKRRKGAHASHADTRADGIRQDDPRGETRGEVPGAENAGTRS